MLREIHLLRSAKPEVKDLKKIDFPASNQRTGIVFADKIRNAFRGKWIRKK